MTATGIFLVTFATCMRALVWTEGAFKHWWKINPKMLLAAPLMFTFASLDVAFHLRHNLDAFISSNVDPAVEFQNTSYWVNVMKMGCYVAQTFVGDSILLYRCWVIYNKRWSVIAPSIILWIGTLACGIMTIYYEATIKHNGQLLQANKLVPFITSMLTLTLAMNVLTTSLMVWRIRKIRNQLKHRSISSYSSPLDDVVRLLVETGLMYTLSIIILFCLYISGNNAQYGVSNAVVQIIGITFNLIITRIDRGDVTSPSQSHRSGGNSLPLHNMINVHTSVTRTPDPPCTPKNAGSGPGVLAQSHLSSGKLKVDWHGPV